MMDDEEQDTFRSQQDGLHDERAQRPEIEGNDETNTDNVDAELTSEDDGVDHRGSTAKFEHDRFVEAEARAKNGLQASKDAFRQTKRARLENEDLHRQEVAVFLDSVFRTAMKENRQLTIIEAYGEAKTLVKTQRQLFSIELMLQLITASMDD